MRLRLAVLIIMCVPTMLAFSHVAAGLEVVEGEIRGEVTLVHSTVSPFPMDITRGDPLILGFRYVPSEAAVTDEPWGRSYGFFDSDATIDVTIGKYVWSAGPNVYFFVRDNDPENGDGFGGVFAKDRLKPFQSFPGHLDGDVHIEDVSFSIGGRAAKFTGLTNSPNLPANSADLDISETREESCCVGGSLRYGVLEKANGGFSLGGQWQINFSLDASSLHISSSQSDATQLDLDDENIAEIFRSIENRYPDRVFLDTGDPPAWLEGQCIAWARILFEPISNRSMSDLSFGSARHIPDLLGSRGFTVETDSSQPRVGAMAIWDDGIAGHVAIVTSVVRGSSVQITVSEANYGRVTAEAARRWGLSFEEAKREFVTENYGSFTTQRLSVDDLDRGDYRFVGYVYP